MKFQRIAKIIERFVLSLSLARDIKLYTLSHEPFILLPDAGGESLFHLGLPLLNSSAYPLIIMG